MRMGGPADLGQLYGHPGMYGAHSQSAMRMGGAPAYGTPYAPRATIGVDVDGDGRADYLVSGVDRNRDGIPDALQQPSHFGGSQSASRLSVPPTMSASRVH